MLTDPHDKYFCLRSYQFSLKQNLNNLFYDQNLNNLFYDIGWRVSKYVDGSQQIVPAANQLGTICRHSSLTQLDELVPDSPVPPESPNAALLPHQAHKKAKMSQNHMFAERSLTFAAHSLTLSATLTSQANARNISNYPLALPAAKLCRRGDCAAKLFCAAYFLGAAPSK